MQTSKPMRRLNSTREMHVDVMMMKTSADEIHPDTIDSIRNKFAKNYFGLPPYSIQQTSQALAYQCRKPLETELLEEDQDTESKGAEKIERIDTGHRKTHDLLVENGAKQDSYAQRKVAAALLIMAKNPIMRKHFLSKGGYEAALRLLGESKDQEVLNFCGLCLIQVASIEEYAKEVLDRGVFSGLSHLCETYEENLMLISAVVIALLSSAKNLDELLVVNNCLSYVQSLTMHSHRPDAICHLVLALCNIAPAIVGPEAEVAMRLVFQATKKLDLSPRSMQKACFIADVLNDFSRLSHYSSLLVDEGGLPLLLHFIDTYINLEKGIINSCTETLANLSINRKNRREIASSGIASRIPILFEKGSHSTCANILLLMGNLLSSNMFHDKVANALTISNMLDNMLDINHPKQFNAVCYCLCQLSKNFVSADMLVQCQVIPIIIGYLHNCPDDSVDYLWTVLQNITAYQQFFQEVMVHNELLITELYEELKLERSAVHQMLSIVKIALNMTQYEQFYTFLSQQTLELFIKTIKLLLSPFVQCYSYIQYMALISLIYLARYCSSARSLILSTDLIDVIINMGTEDDFINVKYAELLYIISNEENCCYRLLDMNIQRFLLSLQDSFQRLVQGLSQSKAYKKSEKRYLKGASVADLTAIINKLNLNGGDSGGSPNAMSLPSKATSSLFQVPVINNLSNMSLAIITNTLDGVEEGEHGKALTAATLHNVALKRPVLAPGSLTMILSLAKNCKSLRVLHCIRTLAQMSIYNKSKIIISKEFKKIVPMLTVIMRLGVMEAERVQYYAAIILCNILSLTLDKTLLLELVKSNAITDLMVVTLLRINTINTKETLAKTFYNLLGRGEIREILVLQMDILSAIIELMKLEYTDLLELCIRAVFNLSCELKPGSGTDTVYSQKFSSHKIPQLLINRIVFNANVPGSLPTRPIRMLLGMCVANMSFHKTLVIEMLSIQNNQNNNNMSNFGTINNNNQSVTTENKLSDALYRIFALSSEESTYCAVVALYNISKLPDARVLADSKAVLLCVEILSQDSGILNIQLAVSALCNLSLYPVFHEQITNNAAPALIKVLMSPTIHMGVKVDIVQCIYNIVSNYTKACAVFIHFEVIAALWKLLKLFGGGRDKDNKAGREGKEISKSEINEETIEDEEGVYILISHITCVLCHDAGPSESPNKLIKMLTDGVMNIILKLAKLEIVTVKVDMSFALYSLTKGSENVKLLKRDAVDILFWLTLYDTLGSTNLIYQNISRSLRSFAINSEEAILLIKQERFLNILKLLVKCKHEDILWQTSGIIYNLMQVNFCLQKMLSYGLVSFIFEMAASNYLHVKHVCSACLHIVPEHLPNIDDPLVLDLILSLLEAQGDKFSDVSKKPTDNLLYPYPPIVAHSRFGHSFTPFISSWTPFTCLLDTSFSPALLPNENNLSLFSNIDIPPLDPAQINSTERHTLLRTKEYQDFNLELKNGSNTSNSNNSEVDHPSKPKTPANSTGRSDGNGGTVSLDAPPFFALAPPGSPLSNNTINLLVDFTSHPSHESSHDSAQASLKNANDEDSLSNNAMSLVGAKDRVTPCSSKASKIHSAADSRSSSRHVTSSTTVNSLLASSNNANKNYSWSKPLSLPLITSPAVLPTDTVGAINKSILSAGKNPSLENAARSLGKSSTNDGINFCASKSQPSLYDSNSFVSIESSSFSHKGVALIGRKK